MKTINDALKENLKDIEKPYNSEPELTGVSTGFKALDSRTNGFGKGKLIVIGARPGMGKSALAHNFAVAAAKKSQGAVAIFSNDILYGQLSLRLLSAESKVSARKFRMKNFDENDLKAISAAIQTLSNLKLYIDDNGPHAFSEILEKSKKAKEEVGLCMVVIDGLQKIRLPSDSFSHKTDFDRISLGLKELAQELDVPVIITTQITRPRKKIGRRPMLKDLRKMGFLEQHADLILLIHWEDYYDENSKRKGIAEIIMVKNREGEPGTVELSWEGALTTFQDYPVGLDRLNQESCQI